MIFKNSYHKERFESILGRMQRRDPEHGALAYLLALDGNISDSFSHLASCFSFADDTIKPGVLEEPWITSTDRRVLSLAFNLWNGRTQTNVLDVFCGGDIEYLFEAVRIRFS